jgi:N-acetylmuramoyl-L-alanine amidase
MRPIDLIVIHCSATPPNRDIGVNDIRTWHVRDRGFRDVGYHYVIRRNGAIEFGRTLDVAGAHAEGFNKKSIGICMVGGVASDLRTVDNFTEAQFTSLDILIRASKHRFPNAKVLGHRDLPNVAKACPAFDVAQWLARRSI